MKITIRNISHGTETTTNVDQDMRLSPRRVAAIRRRLCGVSGCSCGGYLSERGNSDVYPIESDDGSLLSFELFNNLKGGRFEYV